MSPPFSPGPVPDPDSGCGIRGGGLFGRHRGGPFAGRGKTSRLFDSGALRLVVLGMIGEEPRHGYEIIKGLKARLHGAYSPSPGSIYPMLQMLASAGLVTSTSWGPRRRFAISEAGLAYLGEHRAELDAINAQLDEAAAPMQQASISDAIRAFRTTLFQKMRKGSLSPEQTDRLRQILAKARDEIERL